MSKAHQYLQLGNQLVSHSATISQELKCTTEPELYSLTNMHCERSGLTL